MITSESVGFILLTVAAIILMVVEMERVKKTDE